MNFGPYASGLERPYLDGGLLHWWWDLPVGAYASERTQEWMRLDVIDGLNR